MQPQTTIAAMVQRKSQVASVASFSGCGGVGLSSLRDRGLVVTAEKPAAGPRFERVRTNNVSYPTCLLAGSENFLALVTNCHLTACASMRRSGTSASAMKIWRMSSLRRSVATATSPFALSRLLNSSLTAATPATTNKLAVRSKRR